MFTLYGSNAKDFASNRKNYDALHVSKIDNRGPPPLSTDTDDSNAVITSKKTKIIKTK